MIEHHSGSVSYLQFDHLQQFPEVIHGIFTYQAMGNWQEVTDKVEV